MAVGLDRALPRQTPPALGQKPAAPMQVGSVPSRPPAISDAVVQGAVNNQMAAGYGAREMALTGGNRAGISRGKGQQYAAQMAQDSADVKAAAGAAQTEMSAAASNAASRQAYDSMMENERLSSANLLEGLRNTSALERMAGQGWQRSLYEAMRRGRFGLDQQQLDYTPLLRPLFD